MSGSGHEPLRFTLVHLLTTPDAPRERRSVASVAPVATTGVRYVQHRNPPRTTTPPRDTCRRPDAVTSWEDASFPNDWQLGPGHFGCFLAHRRAVLAEFDDTLDLFVICECDCVLNGTAEELHALLVEARDHMARTGTLYLSLGIGWDGPTDERFAPVRRIFRTHCVVFAPAARAVLRQAFLWEPWDTIDYWYNEVFAGRPMAIATTPFAHQAAGLSLLERVEREGR
jgi:hypothetical protein